jgi:hypothetical protein
MKIQCPFFADDNVTLDTVAITLSPNFTSTEQSHWNFKLYDANDNLICISGDFER